MKRAIYGQLAIWSLVVAISSGALAWQTNINGTAALGIDSGLAIAFDNNGNVAGGRRDGEHWYRRRLHGCEI